MLSGWAPITISLLWSTIVGLTGHAEERVWNSFFLQYLWEFCLGMKLAEWYAAHPEKLLIPEWTDLIPACAIWMLQTGLMGWLASFGNYITTSLS